MLGCMHVHDVICMTSSLAIAHCSRVCSALHSSSTANSTAGLGSVSATSEAGTGEEHAEMFHEPFNHQVMAILQPGCMHQ